MKKKTYVFITLYNMKSSAAVSCNTITHGAKLSEKYVSNKKFPSYGFIYH